MSLYTAPQLCMQCLTGLTFLLLVALESIYENQHSSEQYHTYWHPFKSDYTAVKFLLPRQIQNLSIPCCWRWWYHPKLNVSVFVIRTTVLYKSYWMLGGFLCMRARSVVVLGEILDMRRHGGSINIAELRRLAALASCVLFVIKFFAIYPNMGPAQWATTCWQKHTLQSWTNWQSQRLLNWLVRRLMKQH